MKTTLTLLIALLISISCFAQQGINYKALIKDDTGNVMASVPLSVRFTIYKEDPAVPANNVYQESHTLNTDVNGLIVLNIGSEAVGNSFTSITWEDSPHWLEVEINTGTGFVSMGNPTAFNSVPYALHALTSGDKSWESEVDNVHVLSKNVGIGTDTPTALLEINDPALAGIKVAVPNFSDTSKIEFNNGPEAGAHTFYKIENSNDALRFEIDTDISGPTGFQQKMTLSNTGLALQNGISVNEFSSDATLAGNSNSAVPTEQAVKTYVDAAAATAGPIAYGSIGGDGTILSGSGNFSVVYSSFLGRYEITITGETYNRADYTTVITCSVFSPIIPTSYEGAGTLLVRLYDLNSLPIQVSFHFITYK